MSSPKKIAVLGYSFRLPGLKKHCADDLWAALFAGSDLVSEVDPSRWERDNLFHPAKNNPGTSYTFAAGSIGNVAGFDAEFFGISPREAGQMDPQQRLLLEMTWEAFENSGIKPSAIRKSRCGVFVGISSTDYAYRRLDDLASFDASTMTGNTASIAANRISYFFDLRGPSMSVDTACSSSMVAFHQACQAIHAGEADQCLVGGISLHLHPFPFVGFSKASMLSKHGICNAFDAAGEGYVRSEGGGIFVLKDYDKAIADGNRIIAVVAGSGVNCDGKTNGITVPSSEAQAALLEEVYARAGIAADDIDYLEAHGTGTSVGDPIETRGIGNALGSKRQNGPLPIGSVKSNVGHLEAASGVAGLVKALLCLQKRAVPPTIHLKTPNPKIKFQEWNIAPVTSNLTLPADKALTVGINSFGFGGANAHVVLQTPPIMKIGPNTTSTATDPAVFLLSARSDGALQALAGEYAALLGNENLSTYDLAHAAFTRRELLEKRLVVRAPDRATLIARLDAFAVNGEAPGAVIGEALAKGSSQAVFFYSGNGSQWAGMGRLLLAQNPVFRASVQEVDALFSRYGDFSVVEKLESMTADQLAFTEIGQPTLFALQVGLTRILLDAGIVPAAVTGHSVGEVAAAWASGALTLEQAVQVVFHRSAQQGKTKGVGKMTAAAISAEDAGRLIEELGVGDLVCIAGINSSKGVTFAGDPAGLERIETALQKQNVFQKRLDLDYAFHSPAMDPIRCELENLLADLQPAEARIPFISTVTGGKLAGTALGGSYWWDNIRQPVRFSAAIDELIADGSRVFVEIGPHPVLRSYVKECLQSAGQEGRIVQTMTRNEADAARIEKAVGEILVSGIPLDVNTLFPHPAPHVTLPNYPWQKESHWHPVTSEAYRLIQRRKEHPLLGYRLSENTWQWENQIDLALYPTYRDHVVGSAVVLPAAGFIEMALAAATLWRPKVRASIENLEIFAPLLLDEKHAKTVRFAIDTSDGSFSIKSRDRLSTEPWLINVTGRLVAGSSIDSPLPALQLHSDATNLPAIEGSEHYAIADSIGLAYGPAFQAVSRVAIDGQRVIASMVTPPAIAEELAINLLHPSFLDGCFQLLVNFLGKRSQDRHAYIPVRMGRVCLFQCNQPVANSEVTVIRRSPRSLVANCHLFAADGSLVAVVEEARFRRIVLKHSQTDHLKQLIGVAVPKPGRRAATDCTLSRPIADLLAEASRQTPASPLLTTYHDEVEPLLDILCSAYLADALKKLGGNDGAPSTRQLLDIGRIPFDRLDIVEEAIALLGEDGLIEESANGWNWTDDDQLPEAAPTWLTLLEDYPDYANRIIAVGRIGDNLADILSGSYEANRLLPMLANPGAFSFYTADTDFRALELIRKAVIAASASLNTGHRLRVLELGIHDSRLAPTLLEHINRDTCDYVVASPAGSFNESNQNLLEAYPGVELCTWSDSGPDLPAERRFDLILVPDGLTDSTDKVALLDRLRGRLVAGGELLLLEQSPARWATLLQLERDGNRRYLLAQAWKALFAAAGFSVSESLEDNPDTRTGAVLYTARNGDAIAETAATADQRWLLVLPETIPASAAAMLGACRTALAERGASLIDLPIDATDDEAARFARLVAVDAEKGPVSGIVFAALGDVAADAESSLAQQVYRAEHAIQLMRACERLAGQPALVILTQGANGALSASEVSPASGSLWGLGRTMINESATRRVRLVDLAGPIERESLPVALADELLQPDDEDEIILAPQGRLALRIRERATRADGIHADEHTRVSLDFSQPGQLKNLRWRAERRQKPAAGEVEIEVRAAGLNFRDVMYAMGLLSDEAVEQGFAGATLGMELSGIVRSVGPGVDRLLPGMEVIAFAPACFSNQVITQASAVVRKPAGWSHEAAATIPTTFFTVYYALHHLARLQPGEKILIHGAAGGVGIAAIRLAQYLGAEIFATAGSDEKRQFVRQLGADHVLDSRSLDFADRIMEITGGKGIDVVLNSLAGEAINRNLRILRPFGRFLELGKRDFYENTRIGLRPFRNNITYYGIDADQLMSASPELTERLFNELMGLFEEGHLKPLPYRAFPAAEVVEAFRYMQQARQIGKIVVSFRDGLPLPDHIADQAPTPRHPSLPADACYLITGGLSGFGLTTAHWLAAKGAKNLVLVSRRGPTTEESAQGIAKLEALGVKVRALTCDITRRAEVATLFECIDNEMPPLRGIVHAAMVIDDGLLRNMQHENIERVFAPKILGAQHLDELSRNCPLDFFVLYSSATTVFGNPGQGNYVAANYFLEALAARRRQEGLPGLAACWGAIDDVGFLSRNEEIKEALQSRMGGAALASANALDVLDQLLVQKQPAVGVLELDWSALSRFLPSARAPKFRELARQEDNTSGSDDSAELQRWLRELPNDELHAALADLLKEEVSEILRTAPEKIDINRSVYDMGMDSLMAVELITAVDQRFGINLPVMALSEGPTIAKLTERIILQLKGGDAPAAEENDMASQVKALAEQHGGEINTTAINRIVGNIAQENN